MEAYHKNKYDGCLIKQGAWRHALLVYLTSSPL